MPSQVLNVLSGLSPIELHLQGRAVLVSLRLVAGGLWVTNYLPYSPGQFTSHAYHVDSWSRSIPWLSGPIDLSPLSLFLDRKFSTSILPRAAAASSGSCHLAQGYQVYTDGSRAGGLTGAGFVIWLNGVLLHEQFFSLGTSPTVFQCEVFALSRACDFLLSLSLEHSKVSIFSDSLSAIQALSASICRSKGIQECLLLLESVASSCESVVLSWVPGHENVIGNERADELARRGSASRPVGPEPFIPFSLSFIKSKLSSWKADRQFAALSQASISSRSKFPALTLMQRGFFPRSIGTAALRIFSNLVSGHSGLAYFQHILGNENSPLCQYCRLDVETSDHFMGACIAHSATRQHTLGFSSASFVHILRTCSVVSIIKFVKLSGRFERGYFSGRPPD